MDVSDRDNPLHRMANIFADALDQYRITVQKISPESLLFLICILMLLIYLRNYIYNNYYPRPFNSYLLFPSYKLYNTNINNYDNLIIEELTFNLHKFFSNIIELKKDKSNIIVNSDLVKYLTDFRDLFIYEVQLTDDKNDLQITESLAQTIIGKVRTDKDKAVILDKINDIMNSNGDEHLQQINLEELVSINYVNDLVQKDFLYISKLNPIKKIDEDDPIFDEDRNVMMATDISKSLYNQYLKPYVIENEIRLKNTVFINKLLNKDETDETDENSKKIILFQKKMDIIIEKIHDVLKKYQIIVNKDGEKDLYEKTFISNDMIKENLSNYIEIYLNILINIQVYLLQLNKNYTLKSLLSYYKIDLLLSEAEYNTLNDDTREIIDVLYIYRAYYKENGNILSNSELSNKLLNKIKSNNLEEHINTQNMVIFKESNLKYNTKILKLIKDFTLLGYIFCNLCCIIDDEQSIYKVSKMIEDKSFKYIYSSVKDFIVDNIVEDVSISLNLDKINDKKDKILELYEYSKNNLKTIMKLNSRNINIIEKVHVKFDNNDNTIKINSENELFNSKKSKYIINNIVYLTTYKVEKIVHIDIKQKTLKGISYLNNIYSSLLYLYFIRRLYNNNTIEYSAMYNNNSNGTKIARISANKMLFNYIWKNACYKYFWGRLIYLKGYINEFKPSDELEIRDTQIEKPKEPKKPQLSNDPMKLLKAMNKYNTEMVKYKKDLAKYEKESKNVELPETGNVFIDDVIYYHALVEKFLIDTMNNVFDEPGKPKNKPRKVNISLPWPIDALGDMLTKIVNLGNMIMWLAESFIRLLSDFNKLIQFIVKTILYMLLFFISILHAIIGDPIIMVFIFLKEIIILFVYFIITLAVAFVYCIYTAITTLIILIYYPIYYNVFYSCLFANEFNPRSFYLNTDYFKNFYDDYISVKDYLDSNIYEYDLMNNDNIAGGVFLHRGLSYETFGNYAPYWEIRNNYFCKKRESYIPSFNPDILVIRNYMKLMYKEMKELDLYKKGNIDNQINALENDGLYNYGDNFSDMLEIINESYNNNSIADKLERIDQIQDNKREYYNQWVRFKKDNDVYNNIYDIDINKLTNGMYLYSDLKYSKKLDDDSQLDNKEKIVENMRKVYENFIYTYNINNPNEDLIDSNLRLYYNNLADAHTFINTTTLVDFVSNLIKKEENPNEKQYNDYKNNDILRNIVTKITFIFILLGINKIVYDLN